MTHYQFNIEHQDGTPTTRDFSHHKDHTLAKQKAGRLAKMLDCPVDLLIDGSEPHNERYLTTAMPSEVHKTGYRLERLAS